MENLNVSTEKLEFAAQVLNSHILEMQANNTMDVVEHVSTLAPSMGIIGASYLSKLAAIEARHIQNLSNITDGYKDISNYLENTASAYKETDETFSTNISI